MKLLTPSQTFKRYSDLQVEWLNCYTFLQSWCIIIGNWNNEKYMYIHTHSDPSIMREVPNHVILISLDNTSKHLCLPALSRLSPPLWPVLSSTLLLASSWGFNKSFGWILSSGLMLNAFVSRIGSVLPLVLLFPPPWSQPPPLWGFHRIALFLVPHQGIWKKTHKHRF